MPAILLERDLLVIGAGVSGLSAALRAVRAGLTVAVADSAPHVGGSACSLERGGYLLELGPNSYTRNDASEALVDDVGLRDDYLVRPLRDYPRFLFDGATLQAVPTGPGSLLRTPLLSAWAKLRLLGEPLLCRRPPDDESIASFARRHFGGEVLEMFVAPFVSGIYAGDPEQISMPAAFPLVYDCAKAKGSVVRGMLAHLRGKRAAARAAGLPRAPRRPAALCSFRRGLQQLPLAVAAQLPGSVFVNANELRIVPDGDAGRYIARARVGGDSLEVRARGLVLAVRAFAAAELAAPWLPSAADALRAVPYTPLLVVHVGVPLAALAWKPAGFGFLVPRGRGARVLGVLWTSAVFPGRAPEGSALLTLFYGGATDPDIVGVEETAIERQARDDLARTMGWNGARDLWRVTRYEHAIPSYTLGHRDRVAAIEAAARRAPLPLCFVGNYLRGISMQDCIQRAAEATDELLARMAPPRAS